MASTEPPTGTVTFLFTDIEGSTRLTQLLGDDWPPLLERHRRIARAAWVQHGGVEISTEGDSFFVVFVSAQSAVTAAVQVQRELAAETWPEGATVRVRMGLHTGEGLLGGGSYVGIDVHRAARIAAAGHGGQILLSATTAALVEGALPAGVGAVDLGEHRLKDLVRPERIWQLTVDGQAAGQPPPRTLGTPTTLPSQLTSFLGRERELTEISELLLGTRLLTLVGPGGAGKTRLAVQTAERVAGRHPDGVHFVALASVREGALVLPTIAHAVGLPQTSGGLDERLADFLGAKRVLLVLDNFEQVCDAAPVVANLLQLAPGATALATSRSPLRVSGERQYAVPPLAVPPTQGATDPVALGTVDSVALFVERAQSVRSDFRLTRENAAAVAEICARLDGLPLAIELAAARVRTLSPQAIASRLGRPLTLLTGGARDLPERQQTLTHAIDWSHELLDEADQTFFARFSVFLGGADLTAVEEVLTSPHPDDGGDALERAESLLDKSLLRLEPGTDEEPRYAMLETIREYAAAKLAERGEADLARARHARWVVALVERVSADILGQDRRSALDRLEREHGNIRAALTWCIDRDDGELAARIFIGSWRYWQARGFLSEARRNAGLVLGLPSLTDPATRAAAAEAAGGIAYWQGDMEAAHEWYAMALEIERGRGDPTRIANALYNLLYPLAKISGSTEPSVNAGTEALEIYRSLGDEAGVARALWGLGSSLYAMGEIERGRPYAEQAMAALEQGDDEFMKAWGHYMLGVFTRDTDPVEAARHLELAYRLFRHTNDASGHVLVFDAMATLLWTRGQRRDAMRLAGYSGNIEQRSGFGLARVNREMAGFHPAELAQDPELAAEFEEGRRLSADEVAVLAFGPRLT